MVHPEPPVQRTRAGRTVRPSWKVRNTLPEDVGDVVNEGPPASALRSAATEELPQQGSRPHVLLLVTDYVRTVANSFGLRRFYKRRPHRPPQARLDLEACYGPTAATYTKKKRTVQQIIFPFPNITSWRYSWHFARGHKKSLDDAEGMEELIARDDFVKTDIQPGQARKLRELVASGVCEDTPWANEQDGWRTSTVTIGVPMGKKSTQASRRDAAAAARRVSRHEMVADTPPVHAIPGEHYTVPVDFHHKGLCAEIRNTLTTDPAVKDYVFDPYIVEHQSPRTGTTEKVHGEFYNSGAFVQEDIRLQNSPREPGCDLPRVVLAIMLWSDATVVSQFGGKKVWPGYMYFGNQSKYTRARPTAHAAHHIAYFVSVCSTTFILPWYNTH